MTNPYRSLPAIAVLLDRPEFASERERFSRIQIAQALRETLDEFRNQISVGGSASVDISSILTQTQLRLKQSSHLKLRTVINATGIVLHTNLGRSPLHESAARAAYEAAKGYINLELDLKTGERSSRQNAIRAGICRITGAESATAVNNCAAATILALRTLANGKEVIVSRGQLIEIGGSFRIPEILELSGAKLREVGTTNITRASDYERAIGPQTGAMLRVHTSNYRISGFTQSVSIKGLVEIGNRHSIPVIDDSGSGAAIRTSFIEENSEPLIYEGIKTGAALVLFSGDKLLGGPQAGIIAGSEHWIQAIERDPFMRAVRLDKMSLAALEATLKLYERLDRVLDTIPTLRMLSTNPVEQRERSETWMEQLNPLNGTLSWKLLDETSYAGGGTLPDVPFPSVVIALKPKAISEEEFARRLRTGNPAIMARVREGQVLIDLRTVFTEQETALLSAIQSALAGST